MIIYFKTFYMCLCVHTYVHTYMHVKVKPVGLVLSFYYVGSRDELNPYWLSHLTSPISYFNKFFM